MKVLLTGATGFIGCQLANRLRSIPEVELFSTIRCHTSVTPDICGHSLYINDLNTDWSSALEDQHIVIHTAARAHIIKNKVPDPLAEFRKVNVDGTLNLARQAAHAGVRRFVFISSIKVNGEQTQPGVPFSADDTPAPQDPYGISKYEAERKLQQLAQETGMEVVIIRPPLVYGPGVKGNFATLVRMVERGVPLPLGAVHNRRSLVAVDNLVDLIITCIDHPAAANQIFLAGDGEDVSTTELLRAVATAMGKPARLIPVPAGALMFGAILLGKKAVAQRLLGSLQVDISKAREVLGWEPVVSVEEGLRRAVNGRIGNRELGVGNRPHYPLPITQGTSMLRLLDILFSLIGLILGFPILLAITIIGYFDTGSPLFRQERVGRYKKPFVLLKFRTMKPHTVSVASHLASTSSITKSGRFLRRTKLDELPQLWNVLKGEMSLVGPRPNLFNQEELIAERNARGVYAVRPGITGLAQVKGIDMSTPILLAETDASMITSLTIVDYFRYIVKTVTGKGSGDRVR